MANARHVRFVFAVCVCLLTTLAAAGNKVEDLNIQPVRDGSDGVDTIPSGRSPTERGSMLTMFAARLLHGLPRVVSSPGSFLRTVWRYYSAFLADFTWRDTKAEYFVNDSKETFSDEAEEHTGSIISNTMDIDDASEAREEHTTDTTKAETECEDTKEKNGTSDREFTHSMPPYAKHSLQLVLAALTSYLGVSICTYAVKYLHAQRARYLSQTYDVHRDQRRPTEPNDPLWSNLVDRLVSYDDQNAARKDIARRTSPPARLLDEGNNGDERHLVDGLNYLTTDTDHEDRENDRADDQVRQTNEDTSNRNREKEEINCKKAKEATEASDTDRVKDVGVCETNGEKKRIK